MIDQEHLAGKRALMSAAAERIAEKQKGVIDEYETSLSEQIVQSPTKSSQSVRDFLIEDD